jgi:hypothetical protein
MQPNSVNFEEIRSFGNQNDFSLFACVSAKTGEGISEAMMEIGRFVLNRNTKIKQLEYLKAPPETASNASFATISVGKNPKVTSSTSYATQCCGMGFVFSVEDSASSVSTEKSRIGEDERSRHKQKAADEQTRQFHSNSYSRKQLRTEISDRNFVRLADNSLAVLSERTANTPEIMLFKVKEEVM